MFNLQQADESDSTSVDAFAAWILVGEIGGYLPE